MVDWTGIPLSTPEGYATPAQIAALRDHSKAQLYGDLQQPVHHWAQGMSNMANALAGTYNLRQAGQQEQNMNASAAKNIPDPMMGALFTQPPKTDSGFVPPPGAAPGPSSWAPQGYFNYG